MKAIWFWALGCIGFAALSAYLLAYQFGTGMNQYSNNVRNSFVSAQRNSIFKLISELRPPLQADQIEVAAKATKMSFDRAPGLLRVGDIVFTLRGTEVSGVRSSNF
ncbi:MAG TPA: hypothetical protein VHQ92_04670 [Pseudolabrys sp.]|jgi:hypothetical protein|nr:hypothetical protein [Pseudolabrys sp.]